MLTPEEVESILQQVCSCCEGQLVARIESNSPEGPERRTEQMDRVRTVIVNIGASAMTPRVIKASEKAFGRMGLCICALIIARGAHGQQIMALTLQDLVDRYPDLAHIEPAELQRLYTFHRYLLVMLTVLPAQFNLGRLLTICGLMEGTWRQYIKGGDQSPAIDMRVFLILNEGHIQRENRAGRYNNRVRALDPASRLRRHATRMQNYLNGAASEAIRTAYYTTPAPTSSSSPRAVSRVVKAARPRKAARLAAATSPAHSTASTASTSSATSTSSSAPARASSTAPVVDAALERAMWRDIVAQFSSSSRDPPAGSTSSSSSSAAVQTVSCATTLSTTHFMTRDAAIDVVDAGFVPVDYCLFGDDVELGLDSVQDAMDHLDAGGEDEWSEEFDLFVQGLYVQEQEQEQEQSGAGQSCARPSNAGHGSAGPRSARVRTCSDLTASSTNTQDCSDGDSDDDEEILDGDNDGEAYTDGDEEGGGSESNLGDVVEYDGFDF